MTTQHGKSLLQRLREESSLTLRALVYALAALLITSQTVQTVQAAETVTYYHYDALGSPVAATDSQGNVVWREHYQPYGSRLLHQGDASNDLWYTGKPEETALGLQYFGARWYDPVTGRFTGIDPKGFDPGNIQSFNRYAYANDNPYLYIDPDGRVAGIDDAVEGEGIVVFEVTTAVLTGVGATHWIEEQGEKFAGKLHNTAGSNGNNSASGANDLSGQVATPPPDDENSGKKGPKSNGGNAKKHGSTLHNDAIDEHIGELENDPDVSNIRKNQQQVDVNGNKVGTNRPDIQYDKGGCHYCVEYDTVPRNGAKHGDVIRSNDPNAKVELNDL